MEYRVKRCLRKPSVLHVKAQTVDAGVLYTFRGNGWVCQVNSIHRFWDFLFGNILQGRTPETYVGYGLGPFEEFKAACVLPRLRKIEAGFCDYNASLSFSKIGEMDAPVSINTLPYCTNDDFSGIRSAVCDIFCEAALTLEGRDKRFVSFDCMAPRNELNHHAVTVTSGSRQITMVPLVVLKFGLLTEQNEDACDAIDMIRRQMGCERVDVGNERLLNISAGGNTVLVMLCEYPKMLL